jgi:hypothetical protein
MPTHPPAVTITRHPPEHDRPAAPDVAPAGCCCCCCCCCLHTLGGLLGAVSGSITTIEPPPVRMTDPDAPFPFRRDEFEDEGPIIPTPLMYWMLVAFLIGVTALWPYVMDGMRNPGMMVWGLFIAFMILPALQLGASVLSVFGVLLFYPSKGLPLRRVGRITLWSFVGTLIGTLVMGGLCGILYVATLR